jgi:TFA2 Winged helix domain 2
VKGVEELLELLQRRPEGTFLAEVKDAYKGVVDDVRKARADGKLYMLPNWEADDDVLYPR